ncbi:MAG: carboxymuconolactone decarboxylase family protein [Deltaproteobacteria bacterium]|nr:carboxymuconolactone decarboxylase family protein [Deltaproteobacteria bacterium]
MKSINRLRFIEPEEANESTKEVFKKMVIVPNLLSFIANSDASIGLFGYHNNNLDKYKLSAKYRELISLAVSQYNNCPYCIALHTSNAVDNGLLTHQECLEARRMKSSDQKMNAISALTREILENKGNVRNEIIEKAKQQGFDDQEIIETITTISLITQANYTANLARPEMDSLEPPNLE